ncbi:MAG TPA: right-handed parallel beta-helix repeat-containing protein [Bacteroidales bacterium]|nr:right-handed parallel beta-helix repeat-containing protein [Bacteroidales bacterium]
MKKLLILIFLLFGQAAVAVDYFVSSAGSDDSNGTSEMTPWKTIAKVNSSFPLFKPGDRILFRKGDTFFGTLKIAVSGTAASPVTISSYGSGANPVLTGFKTLTGWTNESGGVYSVPMTAEDLTNVVLINGKQYGMGRFPHDSYLTFETHNKNLSITDNSLTGSPDWTGAEVVINKNGWTLDRCKITSHVANTITYTSLGSAEEPVDGRNYFIQNDMRCLTHFGDWYHNTTNGRLYIYFGTTGPSTSVVQAATLKNVIINPFYVNIHLDGLTISGSISSAVNFQSTCDGAQIKNCTVTHAGYYGIYYHGNYGLIDNNTVSDCVSAGINEDYGSHVVISNNTVQNIGLIKGSAFRGTYSVGIKFEDTFGALVQYNIIMGTAYNGISVSNHSAPHVIKNNFIRYSCPWPELDDGGGIYTYNYTSNVVRTIESNIILDIGHNSGVNNSSGIYLDETSRGVVVRNNTVGNCGIGIHIHKGSSNTLEGNNVFNNFTGVQFSNWTYTAQISGNIMNNNVYMAKSANQRVLAFYTTYNEISRFGTAQNNYYARPIDDLATFFIYPSTNETLAQWKTRVTPQDNSSLKSNQTTTDTTGFFKFVYNGSKTTKTIPLAVPMIDVRGVKYQTNITLQPYGSALLMKDLSVKSVSPALTSVAISNSAPSVIEMTYSISLASINPGNASFTAIVNGVRRTISTTNISGSKVLLTMSSPALYGDVITISYTKPATNPLQASTGEPADNLTEQPVTNNIVSPPIPQITSASINNDFPDRIEIQYNLELKNVTPPLSAFSVKINETGVNVSSVSISGSAVFLFLPVEVVAGDNVTFSYGKPASNPVQTTLNGQAASENGKTVTNNVDYVLGDEDHASQYLFTVYPNPANDFICLSYTDPFPIPLVVRIYDFAGKLCYEIHEGSLNGKLEIPINLKSGIYFLHVLMKNNKMFSYKLIIKNQ